MVAPAPHAHRHGHDHVHAHPHGPGPAAHAHGLASPHPAQIARWSILRMTLAGRLGAALAASAALWALVWLAMR